MASRKIFVRNKDKSTGIAELLRAFWTLLPSKKSREDIAHDLCGVALKEIGSREAWLRILSREPSACIMRLSALEGAIQGTRWHNLDVDTKKTLKEFYNKHKG